MFSSFADSLSESMPLFSTGKNILLIGLFSKADVPYLKIADWVRPPNSSNGLDKFASIPEEMF